MSEYQFPGVFCTDREALRSYVMISSVRILEGALAHGFQTERAILPTEPRSLTDEELDGLVAPDTARDPLMLIKVSGEIGRRALAAWTGNNTFDGLSTEIIDGMQGSFIGIREDPPHRPSATLVPRTIGGDSKDGVCMLGAHIDHWKDGSQKLAVANLGPGSRSHLVMPGYNADRIGGQKEVQVVDYILAHPGASACYWFRVDPPDEQGNISLLVNSPVAKVAHDGVVSGMEHSVFNSIRLDSTDSQLLRKMSVV
jgi:hypothetical protein